MESEILKYGSIVATPGTVVLGGYILYRWMLSNFNEIKKALNCKVSKELYNSKQEDTERRIERLENIKNGKL